MHMHQIEEDYFSEELVSDIEDSDVEGNVIPKVTPYTFKKEELCKQFKFKKGIDFSSMKEFKKAFLEHAVLNGRQLKIFKNDSLRVRMRCKQEGCTFIILCSKVTNKQTCRVQTLVDGHRCGRVFDKKIWVQMGSKGCQR